MTKTATKMDMHKRNSKSKHNREKGGTTLRIGTWNIRSLNGKEHELVEEFENAKLDFLAITETKKKGQGIIQLERGHTLLYSGVKPEVRAAEGVGCIIRKEHVKCLKKWEFISGKVLKVELQQNQQNTITLVITYGPSEDEIASKKDKFWEDLTAITESISGRLIILGDFNGRVGKRKNEGADVIGNQGEDHKNNNGVRLINFCVDNNLIITNTFYKHKEIHKFTREVESRNEKSIIDYILINREYRKEIIDVKVKRGPEIYSDHYLVVAKSRLDTEMQTNCVEKTHLTKVNEAIRTYKLQEPEIFIKFTEEIEKKAEKDSAQWETMNLEQLWLLFKESVISTAKETCGVIGINKNKKQTKWWNQELKEQVKIKKEKWKLYLSMKSEASYQVYKQQRIKVKAMVLQSKQQTWEEFGRKIETDSKTNQKLFYKVLKNLRKDKHHTLKYVKAKDDSVLTEEKAIIERWKEYFEELLNLDTQANFLTEEEISYTQSEEDSNIQMEELRKTIKYIKKGKSAGHDKINAEMLKNLGARGTEMLTKIFNKAWTTGKVPEDWKLGIIIPLFKKGDSRDCSNYRGITILSVVSKVYEHIMEARLRTQIEEQLADTQSGFRKGRSVQDHIFSIKQMIEKSKMQNSEIYMAFLDLEKAFDRVPRSVIWKSLTQRKVSAKLIEGIKGLYENNKSYVRKNNRQSTTFEISEGLRQGGVLSPILFLLIMDDIIKATATRTKKVHIGTNKLIPVNVSECAFADDVMICAAKEKDLQDNLRIWEEELTKRNMIINTNKTKVMVISKENKNINIVINQNKIEQVEAFKYLGVLIDREGNTMKSKIQATDMKYLRRVKGITRMDRIRNEAVREELEIESIIDMTEKQKLKWFGHICRMDNDRQVKRIWESGVQKKRTRGRPKKTWNDEVAAILKRKGRTWAEARKLARDKKQWTKFVHEIEM
uniref:Reverse transcriptase domain-containing protein n=2 Tax=Photinus pyralis TaxID=7054 RepID=A0A1Y1M0F5_PHOPY